ncbi:alpha-amylase family glycosyl hydrolase [Pseudoalteromonas sp. T1lg88]|uniref:alpha-amylase family glycosyl hydrolase n=1 Tax=Pseudoalteromonas sp. T1lg88 TaxID=2077104 RepID=UPI000CF62C4A|nr:alpha-amylase family glycosyl hydrolase [Pseudoalteromonas sp. T1lg88]
MINSKLKTPLLVLSLSAALVACGQGPQQQDASTESTAEQGMQQMQKPVVYQVFTRLFGNTKSTNEPWGTLEQNGVGKFADFNDAALIGIKELGVTHIWYTGVLHHAMVTDYSDFGLPSDDPDVVKGRAGSPYAIKDYYNVNPDLASKPADRLREFEELIARTHKHGMKVIIDIVPNHVARDYHSVSKPQGTADFGANDDTSVAYKRDNNFYYVVGEDFIVPQDTNYQVLGGQSHPLADGKFAESPAKWTGNGARKAQPDINDWYETVKINYGVKPDGSYDFPRLPDNYAELDYRAHYAFWQEQELPDSWYKFRDITQYWLEKGVDGFRYDMAEMVPVEFWSFLNSSIKMSNPDAFLLAEVYNPELYRPYIHLGKMDYLYDKVGFYDSLKAIIQGKAEASELLATHQEVADIEQHMLHFLENHDEQRLASPDFAGDMRWGKPAMTVSTLIGRSPSMLYFGQTVGEDGSEEPGFGDPTRTSIFDYIGVPAHQQWMNGGKFDGGALNDEQRALRQFYIDLMALNSLPAIVAGELIPVPNSAPHAVISFERRLGDQRIVVVANFGKHPVFVDIEPEEAMVGKTLLGTDPLYLDKEIPIKLPYQGVTVFQMGIQVDEY